MWKIAICDDRPEELCTLQALLDRYAAEKGRTFKVSGFPGGEQLLTAVEDGGAEFDLVLLDVLMSGLNGIETAARLREAGCCTPLAFLTTSRDFAVESYDVDAAAYLLKPVEPARLWALLDRQLSRTALPSLAVQAGGKVCRCAFGELMYVESMDHAAILHMEDGTTLRCADTLASLEKILLADSRFCRCHKSYLVNFDFVERVDDTFLMTDGTRVLYRVRDRRKLSDLYYRYVLHRATE